AIWDCEVGCAEAAPGCDVGAACGIGATGGVGFGDGPGTGSGSPRLIFSRRISEVADRKSASSSISSSWNELLNSLLKTWVLPPTPGPGLAPAPGLGVGVGALGAVVELAPPESSSLFRTMALNVPVAAVHSGFGGGSTK